MLLHNYSQNLFLRSVKYNCMKHGAHVSYNQINNSGSVVASKSFFVHSLSWRLYTVVAMFFYLRGMYTYSSSLKVGLCWMLGYMEITPRLV